MTSWIDCIKKAQQEGRLSQKAYEQANELFDEVKESLANKMGEDVAEVEAGLKAFNAIKHELAEKKRRELLKIKTWQRIDKNLKEYKNARGEYDPAKAMLAILDRDEFANYSNLEARRKAVLGSLHSKMTDVLSSFRRNIAGGLRSKALLNDVVREVFGEDTGNVSAKELATAWSETAEFARMRFNKAGGAVPKRADWGMPQTHDSVKIRKMPYKKWRDFIAPKLDLDKMIDEVSGLPFSQVPEKLELALREVYETIKTEGWNKIKPSGQALGKTLAGRHADHRFLSFRSADDFLAYQKELGTNDTFSTMMGHLDVMARDIASLEILGPNPHSTMRFMEQTVRKWGAETDNMSKAERAVYKAQNMYGIFSGGNNVPIDGVVARGFAGVRQTLQSAQLGAAAISAITDLNFGRIARKQAGLPQTKLVANYIKYLNPLNVSDQKIAVRMGLIAENWSTIAAGQARYVGDISGPEFTRRIADAVMRLSGLSPLTQAGKWAFGMEFMGKLADDAGLSFNQLDPIMQKIMKKYGIESDAWNIMRSTQLYEHETATFLRPDDITTRTDLSPELAEDIANRYLEMILSETEFAVPSSSLRGRASLMGESKPGSLIGEIVRSFAMYKNFSITLLNTHIMRIVSEKSPAMAADLIISTTLMGGLAIQLKEISKGRDPRPMTSPEFWGAALMQGGGLGIFGDVLFKGVNRFGGGLASTIAGAPVGFVNDLNNLTVGNIMQLAGGDDSNAGGEAVRFARRYIPGASLWYTRLAAERLLFDNMDRWADPKAHKRFRRLERKYEREYNQKFWWKPGKNAPDRMPNLGNITKETPK